MFSRLIALRSFVGLLIGANELLVDPPSCTRTHALCRLIMPTNHPLRELPKSLTIRPDDIVHIRSLSQPHIDNTQRQGTYCRKKANVSLDTASPDLVGPEFPLTK